MKYKMRLKDDTGIGVGSASLKPTTNLGGQLIQSSDV